MGFKRPEVRIFSPRPLKRLKTMSFQPFSLLFGGWETGFRVPFVPHFAFSPAGRGQNVVKIVAGGQTGKCHWFGKHFRIFCHQDKRRQRYIRGEDSAWGRFSKQICGGQDGTRTVWLPARKPYGRRIQNFLKSISDITAQLGIYKFHVKDGTVSGKLWFVGNWVWLYLW